MKLLEMDALAIGRRFVHVVDEAGLAEALNALGGSEAIALDVETARPRDPVKLAAYDNIYNLIDKGPQAGQLAPFDPHTAEVRLVQLKGENTDPYVIDVWALSELGFRALGEWFTQYAGTFILHNAKFDMKMVRGNFGVWIDTIAKVFDTMQASIILANSVGMGQSRGHSLADLARDFLDQNLDKTEQASDWSVADLTPEQLQYAALDVVSLHRLRDFFLHALVGVLSQEEPVRLEMDCVGPTARMEWNGLPFNPKVYYKVQEAARYAMPALLARIGQYFKEEIGQPTILATVEIIKNDGSSDFRKYYLPWCDGKVGKDFLMSRSNLVKKLLIKMNLVDDTGEPLESTKKAILDPLRKENPGIGYLLDYWGLVKQTQFEYDKYVHPLTGRIHAKYNASGASTGRFSCVRPNLMQVPGRLYMIHPDGTKLNYRYCFEVEEGRLMDSSDFAGQELAVMFALSGDPVGVKALNDGDDIHSISAAGMFGIDPKDARQEIPGKGGMTWRDRGKIVMFKQAYGGTAEGFAADFKITLDEAKKLVRGFENKYSVLSKWLKTNGALAAAQNFATLPNGTMRFVGGGSSKGDQASKVRAGGNFGVQGPSAVMSKVALVEIDKRIRTENLGIELVGFVHDEMLTTLQYDEVCKLGLFYRRNDARRAEIEARAAAAKKARDADAEKAAKNELEAYKTALVAACEVGCPGQHCAHRYETIVGECMVHAGRSILHDVVPAGFSSAVAPYWEH